MAVSLQLRASFEVSSLYLQSDNTAVFVDPSCEWLRCVWDLVQRGRSSISLRTSTDRYISRIDDAVGLSSDLDSAAVFDVLTRRDGTWDFRLADGKVLSVNTRERSLHWSDGSHEESASWTVHLASIPTVNMRNASTKRYLCLEESELRVSKDVAWGAEAVVTLEEVAGQYAIRTCSHEYLDQSGSLVEEPTESSLFGLVVKGGRVAFQAVDGTFLSAGGPSSSLASRRDKLDRDGLFILETSRPQVTLTSHSDDLKVAFYETRGDIVADQDKTDDAVCFQLESKCSGSDSLWYIRTHHNKLWQLVERSNAIRAETEEKSEAAEFQLETMDDRTVLKSAKNGKYVVVKSNGHLQASCDEPTEESQFVLELVNRPAIVLQGPSGFVNQGDEQAALTCRSLTSEVFRLESRHGRYSLSTDDEKYWSLSDNGDHVEAESIVPVAFRIRFVSETRFIIQTTDNSFLCHSNDTDVMITAKEVEAGNGQWNYAGTNVAVHGRVTPSPSPLPPRRQIKQEQEQQPLPPSPGPQKPPEQPKGGGRCVIL